MNIFTQFIPQLLRYPNPSDPLNGDAAQLMLANPAQYALRVKAAVQQHAISGGQSSTPPGSTDVQLPHAAQASAGSEAGAGADPGAVGIGAGGNAAAPSQAGDAEPFDFDGVDVDTMDGASCVSDMSDFSAGLL
jgi:hypothetical protein